MHERVCSCGHPFAHHGEYRAACRESTCGCLEYRAGSLPGVYDLNFARRLLRKHSGRPLLRGRPTSSKVLRPLE